MNTKGLWAMVVSSACAHTAVGQQAVLQVVAPGGTAVAISADGSTVLGSHPNGQPFRWTAQTGIVTITNVGEPGWAATPEALSADGTAVVGVASAPGQPSKGWRWVAPGPGMIVPTQCGCSPEVSAVLVATTGNGAAAAGFWNSGAGSYARHWDGASWSSLPLLVTFPDRFNRATAMTPDGAVVVGWELSPAGYQAVRWQRVGAAWTCWGLGDLPGGAMDSWARAASGNGRVIVGHANDGTRRPARWTVCTGWRSLGTLYGDGNGEALAVSADGRIVVGTTRGPMNDDVGFIWTVAGGMQDLNTVAAQNGVQFGPGEFIAAATGISADGRMIIGQYTGEVRGVFVLHLPGLPRGCEADFDNSGCVDPADVGVFINAWFTSLGEGTLVGDFNHDEAVTPADVGVFVSAWFTAVQAGGC